MVSGMIGGVAVEAALASGVFERQPERIVVGAAHGDDAGAVKHHLHELGLRRALGNEDDRLLAGGGADGGQRAGGVAGRGGDDGWLLEAVGLRHDQERGPVFQRGAGFRPSFLSQTFSKPSALPRAATGKKGVLPSA